HSLRNWPASVFQGSSVNNTVGLNVPFSALDTVHQWDHILNPCRSIQQDKKLCAGNARYVFTGACDLKAPVFQSFDANPVNFFQRMHHISPHQKSGKSYMAIRNSHVESGAPMGRFRANSAGPGGLRRSRDLSGQFPLII
ncbi:hypothetical protein, partial [Halocynthiibacter sp.]|uniref:hypothetical protein n=1 Tax=Halocynthiibacter sp. TaxID=1979210 RepID=UPI003C4E0F39